MTKGAVGFIEKQAEKDSKRKKKDDAKKIEDGGVPCLAKDGLIDRDKVKAARKLNEGQVPRRKLDIEIRRGISQMS